MALASRLNFRLRESLLPTNLLTRYVNVALSGLPLVHAINEELLVEWVAATITRLVAFLRSNDLTVKEAIANVIVAAE
jgi:hypothetical protein